MTATNGEPWYGGGLRFECTRCGNCCTGEPGTVRVDDEEVSALARHLELDEEQFHALYTHRLPSGETSLREKPNGDCVFWDRERGCTAYAYRPRQCRTWPFWRAVVRSPERWAEAAEDCPGMNRGPRFDAGHISATSAADGTSGVVD